MNLNTFHLLGTTVRFLVPVVYTGSKVYTIAYTYPLHTHTNTPHIFTTCDFPSFLKTFQRRVWAWQLDVVDYVCAAEKRGKRSSLKQFAWFVLTHRELIKSS